MNHSAVYARFNCSSSEDRDQIMIQRIKPREDYSVPPETGLVSRYTRHSGADLYTLFMQPRGSISVRFEMGVFRGAF